MKVDKKALKDFIKKYEIPAVKNKNCSKKRFTELCTKWINSSNGCYYCKNYTKP